VATREVHDLLASLRERGVTIFLTTHRLEEAERLCHRVAILNTTLRLIGRPDELRQQLFSRSVDVRLRAPLDEPQAVLGAVPEVEGWEQTPSGYRLTVSDPDRAAPALARALVAANSDILSLAESPHSLEDIYLKLIDEDVEATPLLAGWAIWVGIGVSARSTDVRVAQQLSMLGSMPPLVIVALISLNVITASTALALGLAAALLAVDLLAWRVVATMFDRERLVTGRRR
jgi:Domain of unknown function (DUF4162)